MATPWQTVYSGCPSRARARAIASANAAYGPAENRQKAPITAPVRPAYTRLTPGSPATVPLAGPLSGGPEPPACGPGPSASTSSPSSHSLGRKPRPPVGPRKFQEGFGTEFYADLQEIDRLVVFADEHHTSRPPDRMAEGPRDLAWFR